jgi:hypothetical protein
MRYCTSCGGEAVTAGFNHTLGCPATLTNRVYLGAPRLQEGAQPEPPRFVTAPRSQWVTPEHKKEIERIYEMDQRELLVKAGHTKRTAENPTMDDAIFALRSALARAEGRGHSYWCLNRDAGEEVAKLRSALSASEARRQELEQKWLAAELELSRLRVKPTVDREAEAER